MISSHDLLDGIQAAQFGQLGWLWHVLHQPALLHPTPDVAVLALYPLIPWVGVMAAGYALGPVMLLDPAPPPLAGRARRRSGTGIRLAAGRRRLRRPRAVDAARPPRRYRAVVPQHREVPAISALSRDDARARPDGARGSRSGEVWTAQIFVIFGRVPLFYYVAHLLLLHALALILAASPTATSPGY